MASVRGASLLAARGFGSWKGIIVNHFSATFRVGVNAGQMTAGTQAVATEWVQNGSTFTFYKTWGTDPRSLANLKGQIEMASGPNTVDVESIQ